MPYPAQTNRATIVATARELIEREGAETVSLAQLAATLGIKAPSLYRHIPNKDALLQAVNTLTIQELFAVYEVALRDAPQAPQARVLAICRAHRAFAHANRRTYTLAFSNAIPAQRPPDELLEQLVLPVEALLADVVGRALSALRGLLALMHGFVMLEINDQLRRGGDLTATFEAAVAAYLAGW
jgi:AcrR family transcriptional regulator